MNQKGSTLVAFIAIILCISLFSISFVKWSTNEAQQTNESSAAIQAYYLAQMGIIEEGFQWLRTQPASRLPIAEIILDGKRVDKNQKYEDIIIKLLPSKTGENIWAQTRKFKISCVGVVTIPFYNGRESYKEVKRKAILYVEVRNFVDYMYLTGEERTRFNEWINFWSGDTLRGRVHSNSTISIMQSPVFYDLVTTTEDDFNRGPGYSPIFLGPDPIFNVTEVVIPDVAENLRNCASQQGCYYDYPQQTIRAVFSLNSIHFYRWQTGTPFDSSITWSVPLQYNPGNCVFINGPLEICSEPSGFSGRVTIGSSGILRIIDNIRYSDSNINNGITPNTSNNILGIVSESDVKIANTPKNGRENSSMPCGTQGRTQTNQNLTSVIITGAIVALGESFTFEQQNDIDSGYVYTCNPDERGTIYLFGSVTQKRRGYVHRSTLGSTGYLKQYRYDTRFLTNRPPGFFEVTDHEGHALFNVVQWDQLYQDPIEVNKWNIAKYN